MRKFVYSFLSAAAVLLSLATCSDYDDSDVRESLSDLEERVSELESYCSSLNSQVTSLQSAVTAIESSLYVTSVEAVTENGEVIGYTVTFSDGRNFTVYNGSDGADGTDATAPVIGVTLIDGIYYWTLDGEPITDSEGNYIRASGSDGDDAVTPQLKIEDGYWYISYDGGSTWEQLCEAVSSKIEYITAISTDGEYVYLTLYDGTVLTIAVGVRLEVTFETLDISIDEDGRTVEIAYTITSGADASTTVYLLASDGYTATVEAADSTSGVITIIAPDLADDSEIYVLVSNASMTIMRVITITGSSFVSVTDDAVSMGIEGGQAVIPLSYNHGFSLSIPEDADWITYTGTKTISTDSLVLDIAANSSLSHRYAVVTISSGDGADSTTVLISQLGYDTNDNWSVAYYGTEEQDGTTLQRVDYTCGDGSRYQTLVLEASYVEEVGLDSLFSFGASYIASMLSYYDGLYGSGTFVSACYTADKSIYYDDITYPTEYYAFMCGVSDSGTPTGYYQVSEKFVPDMIVADAYEAWLGSWTYSDNSGETGTMIFTENVYGESYWMTYGKLVYQVEALFNSEDGSLYMMTHSTDVTVTLGSNTYYIALYTYYSSTGRIGTNSSLSADQYKVCTGEIDSEGNATLSSVEVTYNSKTYNTYSLRIGGILTTGTNAVTWSNYPMLVFPITLSPAEEE